MLNLNSIKKINDLEQYRVHPKSIYLQTYLPHVQNIRAKEILKDQAGLIQTTLSIKDSIGQ